MTNNDILRRVRYSFDFKDLKMLEVFKLGNCEATKANVQAWLKTDEHPSYQECSDQDLCSFLDGFVILKRGTREGAQDAENVAKIQKPLTNNAVFRKIKIALNLKAEEVLDILKLADFALSKHELSALFRKEDHKNYRECKDQVLRNFLKGIQLKYRQNQTSR